MSELAELQSTLTRVFREALLTSTSWENQKAVKKLQEINQKLNGISSAPSRASIAQVVVAFRRSRSVESRQLKYVCYGAAMQMQDGWCVLGDNKLRDELLASIANQSEARKRLKYFQALLSSYFAFARYEEQTPKAAHAGWEILRDWLAKQIAQFQRDGSNRKIRLPGWFITLTQHENLLTNKPCDRYGDDMLRGDNSSIEEARQGLGIPGNSWVMQEAILSQMRAAVALGDDPFKARLDALLRLVLGQAEVMVSELLKRRAIALLISRYACCASKPEQPVLRDAAVSIIGNPWLKRTAWDASVMQPDGRPDDEAREMVNGWLTRQLITDFFELLSANDSADQRRLNYWLRFVPAIEGTPWLALGPYAMRNNSQPYRDLRERAKGRLLRLENPGSASNNAFIMKMGEWLIVEFGVTGNACYVYPATPTPFSLGGKAISLPDLKNKNRGASLRHADGHVVWERKFDAEICPKVEYRPSQKTSNTKQSLSRQPDTPPPYRTPSSNQEFNEAELFDLIGEYSLQVDNCRSRDGALWVKIEKDQNQKVDLWLQRWGFKYKPGRGWWKE